MVTAPRETLPAPVRSGAVRAPRRANSIASARASSIWPEPSILNFLAALSDVIIGFLRDRIRGLNPGLAAGELEVCEHTHLRHFGILTITRAGGAASP